MSPKNKKRILIQGLMSVERLCLCSVLHSSEVRRTVLQAPARNWGEHEESLSQGRKAQLVLNPCHFLPSSGLPKHQSSLTTQNKTLIRREGRCCMPRERSTERQILSLHSQVTSILLTHPPLPVLLSPLQSMARWQRLWSLIVTFKVLPLVFLE